MAEVSVSSLKKSFALIENYNEKEDQVIRSEEDSVDMYEDKLGSYLVKISAKELTTSDSNEVSKLLHIIGDFERISDHALNIVGSAEEIHDKQLAFSDEAKVELGVLVKAVDEILDLSLSAFRNRDLDAAIKVEPLEEVVDYLREELKKKHIAILQRGECTIEMGFILSDLLTSLERISDHCSNIAGCMLEMEHADLDIHEYLRGVKYGDDKEYKDFYEYYKVKYAI